MGAPRGGASARGLVRVRSGPPAQEEPGLCVRVCVCVCVWGGTRVHVCGSVYNCGKLCSYVCKLCARLSTGRARDFYAHMHPCTYICACGYTCVWVSTCGGQLWLRVHGYARAFVGTLVSYVACVEAREWLCARVRKVACMGHVCDCVFILCAHACVCLGTQVYLCMLYACVVEGVCV